MWSPRGGDAGGEEGGRRAGRSREREDGDEVFQNGKQNPEQQTVEVEELWGCWVYGTSFQPVTDVTRGAGQEGLGRGQTW